VSTIAFAGFEEVGWRAEDATVSVIEFIEQGADTLMTMTQTYPSQEVRDQTLHFMETQPGASGADGYDRLAEMVEEQETDSERVVVRLLPAQPMISIRATAKVGDLAATMGDRLSALRKYLERHSLRPAGAPFVRYHAFPDIGPDSEGVGDLETDVEEGVPVAEALPGEGRIVSGELPGGPVVTTVYTGVPEGLGVAYARIAAWLQEHGEEPAGPAWEVYYFIDLERFSGHANLPDPATWRHRIVQPIK
jgi:effector-binding domain-containing protein